MCYCSFRKSLFTVLLLLLGGLCFIAACKRCSTVTGGAHVNETDNWGATGLSSEEYGEAAFRRLLTLEKKGGNLTAGAAIATLGIPEGIVSSAYTFDPSGNVDGRVVRLDLDYTTRGVRVSIAANGTVASVSHSVSKNEMRGNSSWNWPRDIAADVRPLMSGLFGPEETEKQLSNESQALVAERRTESLWYKQTVLASADWQIPEDYRDECKADLVSIDGVMPDLARSVYEIRGSHILYCDVWWLVGKDGRWHQISSNDAAVAISQHKTRIVDMSATSSQVAK